MRFLSLSLFFSTLLLLANGAPAPRANDDSPGIGVELEIRQFEIVNNDPKAKNPPDKNKALAAVKGAGLVVPGQKTCGTNWALTAEHIRDDIETLTFEWIIDGLRTKLRNGGDAKDEGSLVLPEIWKEIQKALEDWAPGKEKGTELTIKGAEEYGKWKVPKPRVFHTGLMSPGVQITAPLPLSGIQDLISIAKKGGNSPLLPIMKSKFSRFVLIEKKDLDEWYEPKRIDDDMLGFYSLLMSYVKVGSTASAADTGGPKQALPIMPRTSFVTMYNVWADGLEKDKCPKRKRGKEKTRLYEIVQVLAKKNGIKNVDSTKFHWPKDAEAIQYNAVQAGGNCEPPSNRMTLNVAKVNVNWPSKRHDFAAKELSVKTWINYLDDDTHVNDLLATMDKAVYDGQIGALGMRVEKNIYLKDEIHPIFEFRDIPGGSYAAVGDNLKAIEIAVKTYHKNYQPPKLTSKRATNACPKRADDGECSGKQVKGVSGKCEDCPEGTEADTNNAKCKPIPSNKEHGKCKDSRVLDPAEGGQNKDTLNPICKPDDDKECPDGQKAATRPPKKRDDRNYKAKCAVDDKPDFKCKDKDTYDHQVVKNGKLEHSCRATRDTKKKQRKKATQRSTDAKDPKKNTNSKKEQEKKDRDKELKDKSRRTRSGFCFTLLAGVGAWGDAEIDNLSADEIDGLVDTWPDNMQDMPVFIPDWVVHVEPAPQRVALDPSSIVTVGAVFPGLGILNAISRLTTSFAKAGSTMGSKVYSTLRTGSRGPAKAGAKQAAKSSSTVGKILKDQRFLDCLSITAATAASLSSRDEKGQNTVIANVGDNNITVDWSRTDPGIRIQPRDDEQIVVKLMVNQKHWFSNNQDPRPWAGTYPDAIGRVGRLYYEQCTNLPNEWKNTVTAMGVDGGCCVAYADSDCKPESWMFGMNKRQDLKLKDKHNDNIESVWCTFWDGLDGSELCQGAPMTGNGVS
ncbi:hypothetical protein CC86DRAFT_409001 [Ophiobolus disseminans]|uniref:Uncharacterized protein n=1 Tax=Ophiobolus disseminans TaxID=1469910 RepID=A0A6A6ZT91_9PLEO|nr:hypothetical protein CC86DRAFT_409001 [Ophiobolus disseminans]